MGFMTNKIGEHIESLRATVSVQKEFIENQKTQLGDLNILVLQKDARIKELERCIKDLAVRTKHPIAIAQLPKDFNPEEVW